MLESNPLHVVNEQRRQPMTTLDFDAIDDFEGIKERFSTGFKAFVESQKKVAVMDVLREEMPNMADKDDFVQQVMDRLDHNDFNDERYVFLSVNPKYTAQEAEPVL